MRIIRIHIALACIALVAASSFLTACGSSSDEPKQNAPGLYHLAGGPEMLVTNDGEKILLTDTVTHVLRFDSVQEVDASAIHAMGYVHYLSDTGFDRSRIQDDYKKYRLIGLEWLNIDPNTVYVGCFNDYYKDMELPSGYSLYPERYGKGYITPNCMGFKENSTQPGYDFLTTREANVVSGRTQLLFLRATTSGISLNRNVPCEPDALIWYYRLIPD